MRKGRRGIQENDFIIVNHEKKVIICIESKATLIGKAVHKAMDQTLQLKSLLEKYFASELKSGEWVFVGAIYTNNIKAKQPLCASCSSFVIQGPSQLHTKLSAIESDLKRIRKKCSPSHAEYASLIQGLVFVVLSQPLSIYCTIADNVHGKVVGKPAKGKTKAKAGQGDFQSIIFWTNEQANIMLTEQQFVFFASPWSTGKTICMREKAVMWATQNLTEKLYFVVVRDEDAKLTSLLEMELKYFFYTQHKLQNVKVLGLPIHPKYTLSNLYKEVTNRPPGSWMVDEFVMPGQLNEKAMTRLHQQFANKLGQLQKHLEAQASKPLLWIACAGIVAAEANHFERSYLTSILPPAFHLPEMDMPLRNTKKTLAMAGLESNTKVKSMDNFAPSVETKPVYRVPDRLMTGVEGKTFLVNNKDDEDEVARVVEGACREIFRMTGSDGFPLLCRDYNSTISKVKRGVERAGATALIYRWDSKESCSEVEVEEWLRKRRIREKKVLIADDDVSRGWEATAVLVIDLDGFAGFENLVMRTVGYCVLVKQGSLDIYSDSDIDCDQTQETKNHN